MRGARNHFGRYQIRKNLTGALDHFIRWKQTIPLRSQGQYRCFETDQLLATHVPGHLWLNMHVTKNRFCNLDQFFVNWLIAKHRPQDARKSQPRWSKAVEPQPPQHIQLAADRN
jgi:hypothetical protein